MVNPSDATPIGGRGIHVVLLGAGASLAAFPNGDKHGKILPLMSNFIDVVDDLKDYLDNSGIDYSSSNIEQLYGDLAGKPGMDVIKRNVEYIIHEYFSSLELPDKPTLYDHLILSLKPQDMVASFNWDPFLFKACCRVNQRYSRFPRFVHLHGNVAQGYCDCQTDGMMLIGHIGAACEDCERPLRPTPLLYPTEKKDYAADPAIQMAWNNLKINLPKALMFTIFGYSAPKSDAEAVKIVKNAWFTTDQNQLSLNNLCNMLEIIDIAEEKMLRHRWEPFKPRSEHHFTVRQSWYNTELSNHPRRSCEDLWDTRMALQPRAGRPIPKDATWEELDEWVKPLLKEEVNYARSQKEKI